MTKFSTLNKVKKGNKKTVFKQIIDDELNIGPYTTEPERWDNVLHIGYNSDYGDVFKVWENDDENDFAIVFGEKGDEFDN